MKYYFAHPITIYNTRKEQVLCDMIKNTNFFSNPVIENPNQEYHQCQYKKFGMDYFIKIVDECDAVVVYPFEDGTFGAGVVKEFTHAIKTGKRVFFINPKTFDITEKFDIKMCLSVEDTRKKIADERQSQKNS